MSEGHNHNIVNKEQLSHLKVQRKSLKVRESSHINQDQQEHTWPDSEKSIPIEESLLDLSIFIHLFEKDIADQEPRNHKKDVNSHISICKEPRENIWPNAVQEFVREKEAGMIGEDPKNRDGTEAVEWLQSARFTLENCS